MSNPNQPMSLLAALSDEISGAVERASQGVVTVAARRAIAASGILWPDGNGVIVTADHVVERDEDIIVRLANGTKISASVVGRDPGSDLAVLRLAQTDNLPPAAELAPSDSVRIGHLVLAVARPGEGAPMATFGIVSAIGGSWRTARGGTVGGYIRADAALFTGFSGGPLVDSAGRVIGLNSWHLAGGQELAIPAQIVSHIVHAILTQGRVRRAYLGVTSQPVTLPAALQQKLGLTQRTALVLVSVEAGSPADQAGLLLGDVLISLDNQSVTDARDLQVALSTLSVGTPTVATIIRGGEPKTISITPGERG